MRIRHSRPLVGPEEEQSAARVLASGILDRGPECEQFEAALAERLGVRHVRTTCSGTAALHAALLGLGIVPGDEVVFPTYTPLAVMNAIRHSGAFPEAADVDSSTLAITPETVRKAWSVRTRVVLAVHPFGRVVDFTPLREFELPIVEVVTSVLGGRGAAGPPGGVGTAVVCSFAPGAMITTGQGGCVGTGSEEIHRRIVDCMEGGEEGNDRVRFNYSMSDLAAGVGRAQLARLAELVQKRRELARAYATKLDAAGLGPPASPDDPGHTFHRYLVRSSLRDRLLDWLVEAGIEARRPVPRPAHRYLEAEDTAFPCAVAADREALTLPLHPALSIWEAEEVAARVLECLKANGASPSLGG